jgi:hypothetical protein
MFFNAVALAAASFAIAANAHMAIRSPPPIEGSNPKDPLDASGSNFPCHGIQLPTSGGTKFAAGSEQTLAWELDGGYNTAVHGGGSCQISITYETDPAKVKDPKNWFVIYSIEGGCPSNTFGNLDAGYTGPQGAYSGAIDCTDPRANGVDCVNQFNFTIPKGVKSGHGIMSWTWFNTIGNREIYQNCVNADFTGGDGSEMSEFPSMFVANLASVNSCPTVEQNNVKFPYPGKYITTKLPSGEGAKTATTYQIAAPSGSGCSDDGAPGGYANAGGSPPNVYGGSDAPPAPSSAPAAPSGSAPAPSSMVTVTTIATVSSAAGSAPVYSGAPSSAAPAPSAPAAPSSYAAPPAPSGTSSSGSCTGGSVSCTNPGGVVCIGTTHWGLCDINNCAVPQALAAGTHCEGGKVLKRDHVRRHVHRRASHQHGVL